MEENLSMRMWGYLPGASIQRAPFLQPTTVPPSSSQEDWRCVCNGGCGFGLAISESGKINTWGSTNDLGQCYMITGKQQERPEPFLFNGDANMVQAAAGWAHCAAVSDKGEVYTWGWSECVPNANLAAEGQAAVPLTVGNKVEEDSSAMRPSQNDQSECAESNPSTSWDASRRSSSASSGGYPGKAWDGKSRLGSSNKSHAVSFVNKVAGRKSPVDSVDDCLKRRRVIIADEAAADTSEDNVMAPPCLVSLDPGVLIVRVAAGGRHTLALSDAGKVWGWGYGGEGQLGLGSRVRMVSTPQLINCLDAPSENGSSNYRNTGVANPTNSPADVSSTRVIDIACGGRHSAVMTDSGAVLSFGWGLYGQCGQGSTDDELSPVHVSVLGGIKVSGLAAGLWHTVFITDTGDVYACGGNQFGQLGIGGDQAEMLPTLIEAPLLEDEHATSVSCGARHTAVFTETGKIFCWGWNKYGQLGVGDTVDRDTPAEVTLKDCSAKSVACGWWHTLALVKEEKP